MRNLAARVGWRIARYLRLMSLDIQQRYIPAINIANRHTHSPTHNRSHWMNVIHVLLLNPMQMQWIPTMSRHVRILEDHWSILQKTGSFMFFEVLFLTPTKIDELPKQLKSYALVKYPFSINISVALAVSSPDFFFVDVHKTKTHSTRQIFQNEFPRFRSKNRS